MPPLSSLCLCASMVNLLPSPMPPIPDLERLLAAEPSDPFLLYGMAQELAKAGRHGDALAWYDRCLAAEPAYCYAYFHKARTLEALGLVPDAIATLRAGAAVAKKAGDNHAAAEIAAYLDELA